MRDGLREFGRRLIGNDPDASPLMRVIGATLLAANLVFDHRDPVPAWLWAVLVAAYAGWLVFAVVESRYPRAATLALTWCALLSAAVVGPAPDISAFIMLCAAASVLAQQFRSGTRVILLGFAAEVAVLIAGCALAGKDIGDTLTYVGVLVILLLLGLYRRLHRLRVRQTRLLLEQTRRAQDEHARAAALDERARIARELHDVLAHSLGALSMQLEVAELLLDERGDIPGALAHVRRSHRLARDGVIEARGAVAALRGDVPPLPDAVRELVESYRRDHRMTVELRCDGPARPVDSGAAVSLVRTLREALTNAAKHAPGRPVHVALVFTAGEVRLSVRNAVAEKQTRDPLPGGYGLTGMRERIALAGGALSSGVADGEWVVTAEVPIE
ncbi:sensor histidine kinase [Nocardia aobensis]|uniref:sensor histidine kinase n=1 Tax=Nocardia aobensis TaxID=257277 RepID=UPI0002E6E3D5|nr:histidine kinase [Nocardia aobensis]